MNGCIFSANSNQLYENTVFYFENHRIYAQPSSEGLRKHVLLIIDPITKELRTESIPEMKVVKEFIWTLVVDGMIDFFFVDNYMYIENRQLFLTAGSMSTIYRLDLLTEILYFIDIQRQNFPNRMAFSVNTSPVDEAEFNEDRKKVFELICRNLMLL